MEVMIMLGGRVLVVVLSSMIERWSGEGNGERDFVFFWVLDINASKSTAGL